MPFDITHITEKHWNEFPSEKIRKTPKKGNLFSVGDFVIHILLGTGTIIQDKKDGTVLVRFPLYNKEVFVSLFSIYHV